MIIVLSIVVGLMIIRDIRSQTVTNRNTRTINKALNALVNRIQKLERTR